MTEQVTAAADLHASWLAPTRVYGAVVSPVVSWNLNALADRTRAGVGPLLDRVSVGEVIDAPEKAKCPRVLTPLAFVCHTTLKKSAAGLAALRMYARVVLVVPRPPGAGMWDAMECDYRAARF